MYIVYSKQFAPEALTNKYPRAPEYADGKILLFGESLEQVTGTPALIVADIAISGLQENDGVEENILTRDELTTLVIQMLSVEPTGKEVHLSQAQGSYLYSTIFKPVDNDAI